MSIKIESLDVYQISPEARIAAWRFGPTNEDLSGIEVDVLRSYSPTDAFTQVGTVVYPQTYYRDAEVNLRDHWRSAFYKIIVRQGDHILEQSEARDTRNVSSIPAREIVREVDLELKFGGMPIMCYLARKGARCQLCWDEFAKKSMRTRCPGCYGTSYEGGYYEPILTLGNIIPEQKGEQPDVTSRQRSQTIVKMSNFPALRPKDILYEVNAGIRWRVVTINPSEMNRDLLVQEVSIVKLNTGDVEHTLPVPEGMEYVIKPHWSEMVRRREGVIAHDRDDEDPRETVPIWR